VGSGLVLNFVAERPEEGGKGGGQVSGRLGGSRSGKSGFSMGQTPPYKSIAMGLYHRPYREALGEKTHFIHFNLSETHDLMKTTLDLLARAVEGQTNTALAIELNVYSSAFSKARERGRLSPILPGLVAEDVTYWTALAALEAHPPSAARDQLRRAIRRARNS